MQTKNLGCKEDDKRIDLICDNDSALKETTIMLADQLSKEEEVNNSTFETEGKLLLRIPLNMGMLVI